MSSHNNKPETSDTRKTLGNIERVTVETIETIENVTVLGVRTTAKLVTDFVHVTADMVMRAQEEFERNQALLDAIEIEPYAPEQVRTDIYVIDDAADNAADEAADKLDATHDASHQEELLRLQEKESSLIKELSDAIIITEYSERDEMDTTNHSVEEGDPMPMHIQNQEIHLQNEADYPDGIRYKPVKILVRKDALLAAKAHAEEDQRNEVGGILLGNYYTTEEGERVALIAGVVRAKKARQRPASLNFTPEAWADVWRLIDSDEEYGAEDTPWKMMGWYHTHPNFGIFFSGADHSVHDPHFTHPCHVALVIDPCRREFGFFAKENVRTPAGHCHHKQCSTLDDKTLIARWKDATEQTLDLPKAEIPSDVPFDEPVDESSGVADATAADVDGGATEHSNAKDE